MFPEHGIINCRKCFPAASNTLEHSKWRIRNDPGAWGGRSPKYLVLGFSKGATQADIYENGEFDDVGFGGDRTRNNLTCILQKVGLLTSTEHVNKKFSANERDFHFASLVRCSLARVNEKKFKASGVECYETSGALITKSFSEIPHIISACSNEFLRRIPSSVKLVLMLGTNDAYIKKCKVLIRGLYPQSYQEINAIAYKTGEVVWVHLTHPSKGNGHLSAWLNWSKDNTSGLKREMAKDVISSSQLGRENG